MKRLIPLTLLLLTFASPTFSQDSIRIWITPEQEQRVFRERLLLKEQAETIRELKVYAGFLKFENDSLRTMIFDNKRKLDSLQKVLYKDSAKISSLEKQLLHASKIIATKEQIAKKWEGRYYNNVKYRKAFVFNTGKKWIELLLSAGIFGVAVYVAMEITQ